MDETTATGPDIRTGRGRGEDEVMAMLWQPVDGTGRRRTSAPVLVQLRGELDFLSAAPTTRYLDPLTTGPHPDLVLDLARLSFLDCSGIGVLCRARRRVRERGGRLSLVITDPRFLRILGTVGLGDSFDVRDRVPEPARPSDGEPHRARDHGRTERGRV
ncbi:STAS domain-containing protein [Streptomyces sp. NPDC053427]|uniref:STAS domain-containing protein n=1 Tax=Streptomyces sp. NPDC053427 TaxID=3365701 RepID=UPI0037CDB15D